MHFQIRDCVGVDPVAGAVFSAAFGGIFVIRLGGLVGLDGLCVWLEKVTLGELGRRLA